SSAAYGGANRCATGSAEFIARKFDIAERSSRNPLLIHLPPAPAAPDAIRPCAGAVAPPTGPPVLSGLSTATHLSPRARSAMLAQRQTKSNHCYSRSVACGSPQGLSNPGSMCYQLPASARLRSRMGDRLTVGQRTLTPPV